MTVVVTPDTFSYVEFDAGLIRRVGEQLVDSLGIDRTVRIAVDETTPLARISVEVGDEIVVHADSGAFEDTRRPRQMSEVATATSLGRVLYRSADRVANMSSSPAAMLISTTAIPQMMSSNWGEIPDRASRGSGVPSMA